MSDWIDDLTKKEAARKQSEQLSNESRLHDAQILSAKLPLFWQQLVEQVEADCVRLKSRSPDNRAWHCKVTKRGPLGFRIENEKPTLPRYAFLYVCNTDGKTIDITELETHDVYQRQEETLRREQIHLQIDVASNFLVLFWRGQKYDMPAQLGEAIIKRAIGESV